MGNNTSSNGRSSGSLSFRRENQMLENSSSVFSCGSNSRRNGDGGNQRMSEKSKEVIARGSGCARRDGNHKSDNGDEGNKGCNCDGVGGLIEKSCDTQPGKVAEMAKEDLSGCFEVLSGIGNGGDRSSNGIGGGDHHDPSSGRHNGVNSDGRPSEMDSDIDAMIEEEEEMELVGLFDEIEHAGKTQEGGEDQAMLSDVNTDEESVDDEDWRADCDPRPSAEGSLILSHVNDPSTSELVRHARNRYGIQSSNPEDEEFENKRYETQELVARRELRSWTK